MEIKIGDLFSSRARTIVNTVNCVGVMGKGIALEFKNRYPEMYKEYKCLCNQGEVKPGVPYYYTDLLGNSIINFPTKDHWRSPSKLSYVISGLDWFRENYQHLGITSIAFPPLGCGNGGLSWEIVGPLMYNKLKDLPIDIEIYAPYGTSKEFLLEDYLKENIITAPSDVVGSKNSKFNKYWYLILYVIQKLNEDKYSLNVGRVIRQKICFLLTRVGIPTGFTFSRNSYGPYSAKVNEAIVVLSNANLLTEVQLGMMIETRVAPNFALDKDIFTEDELKKVELVIDLLSRVKDTSQAEMITTVMYSFDQLAYDNVIPTEKDILDYVLEWKKHWNSNSKEIIFTIKELSELKWINPDVTKGFFVVEDDLM